MVRVDASAQPTTVHPTNSTNSRYENFDRRPLPTSVLDHRNSIESIPCEIAEPVPMAASIRGLNQTHDLVERRLGDGSKFMSGDRIHEDKIHTQGVKSRVNAN